MDIPDLATLSLRESTHNHAPVPAIPDDIAHATDRYMVKLRNYAASLPYSIEPYSKMQDMLDFILLRIAQSVEAKDYDPGFVQWDSMLTYWCMMKYPISKSKRIALLKLYFHMCTTPGMPTHILATCSEGVQALSRSKVKLSIDDLRLPWKPIYNILRKDLFLTRRQFEISQVTWYMGHVADIARRFFHPAAIDEMLSSFLPMTNGASLNTLLASQYYMLTFLPLSHPQSYLPMLFRMWKSINSYMYDDRMLQFLARLAEMHVDPTVSDPKRIEELPDDARSEDEGRPEWSKKDLETRWRWSGLYSDVGIFSENDWNYIMSKCLASMEIPLADSGSLTTGPNADGQASFELNRLPRPGWRIASLARIIVYSMAPDGMPAPSSNAPTPVFTPFGSGTSTPLPHQNGGLGDYLSAPIGKGGHMKVKTYIAGCKALDALAKLIASTEGFFHPTNSGSWTSDLTAFIKYIVYDFNKRWYEEQKSDCKTPPHRRLTKEIKRELVKSLRTVSLLAMFSQDNSTVSNIQSCMKSMSIMEPDLILHPVIERAVPALEALVETHRTTAVIKALGAVAPSLVCREVYYPGAKHLMTILELLLPGIDLNDPPKTFCTTSFISDIAQYIKFGELATTEVGDGIDKPVVMSNGMVLDIERFPEGVDANDEVTLSKTEEDALLRDTSVTMVDWVAAFFRRVILLFDNLPEEGPDGSAGGPTEVALVDAVCGTFSQICVHLSEPLYDMVLNLVFSYASENVRSNAVRAIHQLVECVANADPRKTLARFLPFCDANIRTELDHGASSLRTTSSGTVAVPSDATLHWNLAILRGAMYNDGRATLPYREQLISLFRTLHKRTLSKRGYSSSGKLLLSTLLTLSHTYPLENKFVNPDEWASEDFRANHHKYWGKLYKPEDVKISWHVPNDDEIDFVLQIFRELVEPVLDTLHGLLGADTTRDEIWRNDFCRHLNFVRNAFSGIPTLAKEVISEEELKSAMESSDILHEIPEMIASIDPLNSGFALSDPSDSRHQYITALRRRFGEFLHEASVSLGKQGEENTIDGVRTLLRAIRTYMLEYGDSKDSYYLQVDRYTSESNIARHHAGQKAWPRALYVRRARVYHAARLRWNSIERRRGELENQLIDDVTHWTMWNYATIRQSAQSLLESLCNSFDGVRSRCLPTLCKALEPGSEDDRMKGALWTLNLSVFAKFAVGEPTLATDFVKKLFACQHNEKPSIQDCVSSLAETCVSSFVEPLTVIYSVNNAELEAALDDLRKVLPPSPAPDELVDKCRTQRVHRVALADKAHTRTTETVLEIANNDRTHWRYAIVAARCLRSLLRRDTPLDAAHVRYTLNKTCDSNATMRYYSQRGVMKASRYIKLRSLAHGPADIALEQNHNPLRRRVPVDDTTPESLDRWLVDYRKPLDLQRAHSEPIIHDKTSGGWIAWNGTIDAFLAPDATKSTFQPWGGDNDSAVSAARSIVTEKSFWEKLSTHWSTENSSEIVSQDNLCCAKSIFQMLDDEPWEALRPTLETLLADKDKNKQRAAAEFLAGVIIGSKHWPTNSQLAFWKWFTPYLKTIFGQKSNECVSVWSSFFEHIFYNVDPRRLQPIVDHIIQEFKTVDFKGESTFDIIQVLCFYRAFYEQLGVKFAPWTHDTIDRCWAALTCEHDDVLGYFSEIFAFCGKIMWRPCPSELSVETFVRECRTLPVASDIMGARDPFLEDRVLELVKSFPKWREERLPGARAPLSTYDRVGIMVCKWLFLVVHDTNATSALEFILPLMPELVHFVELNDNDDLSYRAKLLLVRMCGVIVPTHLINPLLDELFKAIQTSPSWKVRLRILPLVQVYYFRQGPLITDGKIIEMVEVLCKCLDDEVVEVREMAATTLSGILRLSPRRSVLTLKNRFVRLVQVTKLPEDKRSPLYNSQLRQLHAAILGITALIDSFPYTIEKWMPELLTNVLAEHTYDPIPVSTTVRKCASGFRKTHQDTWHEDSKKFTEEQLAALSTLLSGSSYYA